MMPTNPIVFLVDVDDNRLENDRIQDELRRHIESEFGAECRDRFWAIQNDIGDGGDGIGPEGQTA